VIVAELFDVGESRTVAWARRLQSAALVAQLADPGRGWDAVVVGEYERAFCGSQYAAMAPLFEHYGVQLWMPETGSIALTGWALGSAVEGLASIIVIWRFTGARAMSESAERRAQRGVAVSFWLLAPYIAIQTVRELATHHPIAASVPGIVLTASSVVIMPVLGITKQRLGRRLGSGATAGEGIQNLMCASACHRPGRKRRPSAPLPAPGRPSSYPARCGGRSARGAGALGRFHVLFERGHVGGHFLACFPADHQRHQDLADAVTSEVDADSQPGPGAGHRLDQDIDRRRMGPSMPRTPQVLGGSICVSSAVDGRLAPPMRRVVTHFAPTAGVPVPSPGPSMCPSTTPFCHWLNRAGSVA
jgi:hypothetical protein